MKILKFNAVHTRKKHDQCHVCAYYTQSPYFTAGGKYFFEFCTSKGHKGIIIQYRDRTERGCFDFKERENMAALRDGGIQNPESRIQNWNEQE